MTSLIIQLLKTMSTDISFDFYTVYDSDESLGIFNSDYCSGIVYSPIPTQFQIESNQLPFNYETEDSSDGWFELRWDHKKSSKAKEFKKNQGRQLFYDHLDDVHIPKVEIEEFFALKKIFNVSKQKMKNINYFI